MDGVPVPVVPDEHPRLFLRERDLEDLRRRTGHPALQPLRDDLQSAAKNDLFRGSGRELLPPPLRVTAAVVRALRSRCLRGGFGG
jgi:hypothetical protein